MFQFGLRALVVQDATPLRSLEIPVALPPVSRSVEMRIVREVDLCAAVVGLCKAAITLPARAIARIVEIGVLRDDNSLTGGIAFEIAPLACPGLPVSGPIQKGVLRNRDCDACIAFDLVATVTKPSGAIGVSRQIRIVRHNDFEANVVDFHVATKAVPSLSRRVEISAFGHDDLQTSRIIDLLKSVQTLPALAIGPVGGIGVLRNDDGETRIAVSPVPTITFPASAIAFGLRIRGIGAN